MEAVARVLLSMRAHTQGLRASPRGPLPKHNPLAKAKRRLVRGHKCVGEVGGGVGGAKGEGWVRRPIITPTIRCVRCGVTETCKWRLDGGDRVCNKCGLRAAGRRRRMPTCTLPALS